MTAIGRSIDARKVVPLGSNRVCPAMVVVTAPRSCGRCQSPALHRGPRGCATIIPANPPSSDRARDSHHGRPSPPPKFARTNDSLLKLVHQWRRAKRGVAAYSGAATGRFVRRDIADGRAVGSTVAIEDGPCGMELQLIPMALRPPSGSVNRRERRRRPMGRYVVVTRSGRSIRYTRSHEAARRRRLLSRDRAIIGGFA
jgi:hypothetical protein